MRRELQPILMVFSCGPDGGTLWAVVRRDDGLCKLIKKASFGLDTRYETFKPNFLRPHFVQRNFFFLFFFWEVVHETPFYGKTSR